MQVLNWKLKYHDTCTVNGVSFILHVGLLNHIKGRKKGQRPQSLGNRTFYYKHFSHVIDSTSTNSATQVNVIKISNVSFTFWISSIKGNEGTLPLTQTMSVYVRYK